MTHITEIIVEYHCANDECEEFLTVEVLLEYPEALEQHCTSCGVGLGFFQYRFLRHLEKNGPAAASQRGRHPNPSPR